MDVCQECGSRDFESRWKGLTYQFRCARCHWGAATSRFPPIRQDDGPYRIVVTSLGINPARALIALNQRLGYGIRRTRELFSKGERECFSGNASAVLAEARRLRPAGVLFRIEPDFPYDLETYDPTHGHEHDWKPITAKE